MISDPLSPKIASLSSPVLAAPALNAEALLERVRARLQREYLGARFAGHRVRAAALRESLCILSDERRKASTVQTTVPTYDPKSGTVSSR